MKMRKMMKRLIRSIIIFTTGIVLQLLVILPAGAYAKSAHTPGEEVYIVVMQQAPAIAYEGGQEQLAATRPRRGQKFEAGSLSVRNYRSYLKRAHDAVLAAAGVGGERKIHDYSAALNGFAAVLTAREAAVIAQQEGVVRVIEDVLRFKQTDATPSFLGLDTGRGPWLSGVDGEDVVVGVIDTGIWPEHPSFADDGTYPDLGIALDDSAYAPCNFGNGAHNREDATFECNNKLLGGRQILDTYKLVYGLTPEEFDSARDDDGHGTHTASTAAGNAGIEAEVLGIPRGSIAGIAPRARIIAYKGLGAEGGFSSDLAAAIDQAVADGCDVINYSVGGGASLTGADDIAFLFAANAGVFVATSAGNS
jgi:subtilisin family serine protease